MQDMIRVDRAHDANYPDAAQAAGLPDLTPSLRMCHAVGNVQNSLHSALNVRLVLHPTCPVSPFSSIDIVPQPEILEGSKHDRRCRFMLQSEKSSPAYALYAHIGEEQTPNMWVPLPGS